MYRSLVSLAWLPYSSIRCFQSAGCCCAKVSTISSVDRNLVGDRSDSNLVRMLGILVVMVSFLGLPADDVWHVCAGCVEWCYE